MIRIQEHEERHSTGTVVTLALDPSGTTRPSRLSSRYSARENLVKPHLPLVMIRWRPGNQGRS